MWTKVENKVIWRKNGRTEVFDEKGLRHVIRGYLSDESRDRFAPHKFMDDSLYLSNLNHLIEGLSLFYK